MTTDRNDERIREEFRALRSEVERSQRVPDFDAMLARAKAEVAEVPMLEVIDGGAREATRHEVRSGSSRRRVASIGGWVSLATAAVAAGLLLVGPPASDADREFEQMVSAYSSDLARGALRLPTTSLLDIPGLDLGAVPSVGGTLRSIAPGERPGATGSDGRDS